MVATRWGVLVGVDGSEPGLRAAEWAAADAAATGAPLTVCHVAELPVLMDVPLPRDQWDDATRYGHRVVKRALTRISDVAPDVLAKGHVCTGNAAGELLRMAAEADQVVLGSRGLGGFGQLLLGSVGSHVAAHARCPVVVVRGGRRDDGKVVVGVDASVLGERALAYAFEHAARHGLSVHAVHALPVLPVRSDVVPPEPARRRAAELLLEDAVAAWSAKHPAVPVERTVVHGSAAGVLTEASQSGALVVVGSRGHGGFAGLLLGSVSQAVLRHAGCPVAVVR